MKRNILFISLLSLFLIARSNEKLILNSSEEKAKWRFSKTDTDQWYPAVVPGSVHTDLFRNKLIPHPFYGCNEEVLRWIENENWDYSLEFEVTEEFLAYSNLNLIFEGLDTKAVVYLNDSLVLEADNMFRLWQVNVKNLLRMGNNTLLIRFSSPVEYVNSQKEKLTYELPGGEWAYIRKAAYHFGWDWGPRFVTSSIYKPVYIQGWNELHIENVFLYTEKLSEKKAELQCVMDMYSGFSESVVISVVNEKSGETFFKKTFSPEETKSQLEFEIAIKNPQLWWTHDLGEPYLYPLIVEIKSKNARVDTLLYFGVRTIELVTEKDQWGNSFYFKLNGRPVFMKGANYIPQHSFVSEYGRKETEKLILQAVESNMNMLRVWGGGIYEDQGFYSLCDKHGLLVWQDFMFACSMVRGDAEFLDNIRQEALYQVKRLRNHPSIALWCGNNESSEGWHNWGWQKQYKLNQSDSAIIWNDYQTIFHEMIPGLVTELDPSRSYWPSSPKHGWGRPQSMTDGDSHYWGVWWGFQPFQIYRDKTGRFMSEYGFQALPAIETLLEVIPADSLFLNASFLNCHQKHPRGFETIQAYMAYDSLFPCGFDDYIYFSQLVQAYGIKTAIEAHRTAMPRNMGSLYWQLNDCWPVISWSGIDYYGRWKAMQYFVRKSFDDILVSIEKEDNTDKFLIHIVSDRMKKIKGILKFEVLDFHGNVISQSFNNITVLPNRSAIHKKIDLSGIISSIDTEQHFISVEFKTKDKLYSNLHYFTEPGNLVLPEPTVRFEINKVQQGYQITIYSDKLAKNVFPFIINQNIHFSDNFFDILPGKTVTIFCHSEMSEEQFRSEFRVKTFIDFCSKKPGISIN